MRESLGLCGGAVSSERRRLPSRSCSGGPVSGSRLCGPAAGRAARAPRPRGPGMRCAAAAPSRSTARSRTVGVARRSASRYDGHQPHWSPVWRSARAVSALACTAAVERAKVHAQNGRLKGSGADSFGGLLHVAGAELVNRGCPIWQLRNSLFMCVACVVAFTVSSLPKKEEWERLDYRFVQSCIIYFQPPKPIRAFLVMKWPGKAR